VAHFKTSISPFFGSVLKEYIERIEQKDGCDQLEDCGVPRWPSEPKAGERSSRKAPDGNDDQCEDKKKEGIAVIELDFITGLKLYFLSADIPGCDSEDGCDQTDHHSHDMVEKVKIKKGQAGIDHMQK